MSEHLHELLKIEIERVLGRKILTSADCRYLCNDLKLHNQQISFNTLRRFFGFLKYNHNVSAFTLNALASYCGYSSFNDFALVNQNGIDEKNDFYSDILNYLVKTFDAVEVSSASDNTFASYALQAIQFIDKHPALANSFQSRIAQTENGRIFYFENCLNLDRLNTYVGEGLRYYISATEDPGCILYGNYILALKNWLVNDTLQSEINHKRILSIDQNTFAHPSHEGYCYLSILLYSNAHQETINKTIQQLYTLAQANQALISKDIFYFRFYIHLLNSLVLTQHFSEALYFISELEKFIPHEPPIDRNIKLLDLVPVLKAISLCKTGQVDKSKKIFSQINPTGFHFLHQRYLSILYLALKGQFQKIKSDETQTRLLIKETGFSRLNNFLVKDHSGIYTEHFTLKTAQDMSYQAK